MVGTPEKRSRRDTPWIRRLPGTLLLALCAGACGRAPEAEKSADEPTLEGDPSLQLEPAEWDFGNAVQYTELRRSVTIRNAGNAPLLFQAEAGHSCSAVPSVGELAPRTHGELEIHCRPRMHGVFADHVILRTNDPKNPERRIAPSGQVEPTLVLEPAFLEVRLPFGGTRTEEVRVAGARGREARLAVGKPQGPGWPDHGLSVEGDASPKGEHRALRIRFDAKHPGMHAGHLVVTTGIEEPKEILLSYLFVVAGTLEVTPNPVYLNLRAAGEKVASLVIQSTQRDFEVHSIDVLEGPFEATLVRVGSGHYRADLRVREERLDEGIHGAVGRVTIRSNDRTEPRKEVPLFAFGKILP